MTDRHRSDFILGGARSGKSRHALALARPSRGPVVFLATAQDVDGSMRARIARHRAERPRQWTTIEEPFDIVAVCRRLGGDYELAIIDCVTLWVSNRLRRGESDDAILSASDELAEFMATRRLSLIVVSNEVGQSVHPSSEIGLRFQGLLGSVNQRIAAAADTVALMVAGIPLRIKDIPAALTETFVSPSTHGHPREAP